MTDLVRSSDSDGIRVFYDISVLGASCVNERARTGVFRVVDRIARYLLTRDDITLSWTAYGNVDHLWDVVQLVDPLLLPGGQAFGTICVLDSKENHYSPMYEVLLSGFRDLVEHHLALIHGTRLMARQIDWLREFPADYDSQCIRCARLRQRSAFQGALELLMRSHEDPETLSVGPKEE